jgi:hypothetical protein
VASDDSTIVQPVQHGSMTFGVREQTVMLKALDAAERLDPDLKDEIRAQRQDEILERGKAEVKALFEREAADEIRTLEQAKAQILAEARTVSDEDARVAGRIAAFAPTVAQSRTPDAMSELWDEAFLTANPTAIRLMFDSITARLDDIDRVVKHEGDLAQTRGVTRRNPDLHMRQREFAALRQRLDREFGEWRSAHPSRKEQLERLDRQIGSIQAQVPLKLDTFLVLFGPRTKGPAGVPVHQMRRFGSISIGPGFDRVLTRRTPSSVVQ